MHSVAPVGPAPTNLAPLPPLLAYAQGLGLERRLFRPKRGIPTLVLALVWLVLAWRGTGRPHRLGLVAEPLLAALLGRTRLPCAQTLHRSLGYFSAHTVRPAVEAAYLAELRRRSGRVWAAVDAHQVPSWGRGKPDRFEKGWSGNHSRRLRGFRLYLAVDTDTGQIITFALVRGRARDADLLEAQAPAASAACSGGAWPGWWPIPASPAAPRSRRSTPPRSPLSSASLARRGSRRAWAT